MSYKANETQQVGLNDRFNNLTEKEKKVVLNSWAKPFADIIFPSIQEDDFAVLYSENKATRPNTPINIVVGAMIIKEIVGMTGHAQRKVHQNGPCRSQKSGLWRKEFEANAQR